MYIYIYIIMCVRFEKVICSGDEFVSLVHWFNGLNLVFRGDVGDVCICIYSWGR